MFRISVVFQFLLFVTLHFRVWASGAPPSSTILTSSKSSCGWWGASKRVSSRLRGAREAQTWHWGRMPSSSCSKDSWENLNALSRAGWTSITGAQDSGSLHHPIRSSPLTSMHVDQFALMIDQSVCVCVCVCVCVRLRRLMLMCNFYCRVPHLFFC